VRFRSRAGVFCVWAFGDQIDDHKEILAAAECGSGRKVNQLMNARMADAERQTIELRGEARMKFLFG
jgi:DNA-binding GntR family transcriptional regulator